MVELVNYIFMKMKLEQLRSKTTVCIRLYPLFIDSLSNYNISKYLPTNLTYLSCYLIGNTVNIIIRFCFPLILICFYTNRLVINVCIIKSDI